MSRRPLTGTMPTSADGVPRRYGVVAMCVIEAIGAGKPPLPGNRPRGTGSGVGISESQRLPSRIVAARAVVWRWRRRSQLIATSAAIAIASAVTRQAPNRAARRAASAVVAARGRVDTGPLVDAALRRAQHLNAMDVVRRRDLRDRHGPSVRGERADD